MLNQTNNMRDQGTMIQNQDDESGVYDCLQIDEDQDMNAQDQTQTVAAAYETNKAKGKPEKKKPEKKK